MLTTLPRHHSRERLDTPSKGLGDSSKLLNMTVTTAALEEAIENALQHPIKRRSRLVWAGLALLLVGLFGSGYRLCQYLTSYESTDDAQIDGHVNAVSARIHGQIIEVLVQDQQIVKAGDVLAKIDARDYEIAVARAEADLADAEATTRSSQISVPITATTTTGTLLTAKSSAMEVKAGLNSAKRQFVASQARLEIARAQVREAEADYHKAEDDVARYKQLIVKEEISEQQYDHVVQATAAAKATLDARLGDVAAAQQEVTIAQSNIEQTSAHLDQAEAQIQVAMTGPEQVSVSQARADSARARLREKKALVEQAKLNLSHTTILAPVGGIIGKKTVEAGQNVSPGQQLMAIVPLDRIWVIANFKETQLRRLKLGQKVRFTADADGRNITGRVTGIGGASGARFSLLPPENATGNYVKVLQRIPVRIDLDPGQNQNQRLRPGMSVLAKVYLR
jgi:membrane fusion protein (multidrug efflux system)